LAPSHPSAVPILALAPAQSRHHAPGGPHREHGEQREQYQNLRCCITSLRETNRIANRSFLSALRQYFCRCCNNKPCPPPPPPLLLVLLLREPFSQRSLLASTPEESSCRSPAPSLPTSAGGGSSTPLTNEGHEDPPLSLLLHSSLERLLLLLLLLLLLFPLRMQFSAAAPFRWMSIRVQRKRRWILDPSSTRIFVVERGLSSLVIAQIGFSSFTVTTQQPIQNPVI